MAKNGRVLSLALTAGALTLGVVGSGCSDKLETGYRPNKLGANAAERRAFYAAPFTPEAAAGPDRDEALDGRRFRPGY